MDSTVVYLADKIGAGLTAMAAAMQTPVEHMWGVIVRQAIIEAWAWMIGWIIVSTGGFIVVMLLTKPVTKTYVDDWENKVRAVIRTAVGALCAFIILMAIGVNIPAILNPEFYALQEVAHWMSHLR